ncbi:alpha/beta hydrolase [Pseudomonas sp. CCI3.2]|uniref:alpha/beta hydrolase n=1 Tax=unclassified Pseudomonas TaxID=196821 RepID=UPI002AC8EFB5|nr:MULTISPECIES: alpha/beta hydrolase [unclassified Pseudomonas]MEB0076724.1 alpha/beta hydrolase [Pseudomonas sp. MH10out]MEB0101857.1 alpha/beta hydrolase [Pseudomonas sp. CCI3.2]MEB0131156.1 alpha/beta hydrolase [Pseudomonas sp. CCI2.4]MEB0157145.1 alpha/beta hydrolase [Pseudomonas sp. AH2 (2023)]MEB0167471.1 alpha/beta hydrolase [Pseudomonas sp. CCC4.4]
MIKPLLVLLLSTLLSLTANAADQAVKALSPERLAINGSLATIGLSKQWKQPQPGTRRAVIIIHGRLRNAQTYLRSAEKASYRSGLRSSTLLIAPQFLDHKDIVSHHLPENILRWHKDDWMDGSAAINPSPVSSFTVIDEILTKLSDRKLFPNLQEVVIAGHSGGAQVVQRYVMVGKGGADLEKVGIKLRYVIANPSSYAYFSPDRPEAVNAATCPGFDTWKYGMNKLPPYAGKQTAEQLEATYVSRDVTYLLGQLDTDVNHPALDKTCAGEAQGAYRLIRGHNFFSYLQKRHPEGLKQQMIEVPGVGHDGDLMFTSPEGQAALFRKL